MNKKELSSWLTWIEACHPQDMELGLDRVASVYQSMGAPKLASTVITLAGTNGKGSTSKFLEVAFLSEGSSVGVYSSPHLHVYNERFTINGQSVSDDRLCEAFEKVELARSSTELTYFEISTLVAFQLFSQYELDVVLLEVGLGGRLDAVNIIDADIAVITSIGLDHCEWLGNTVEEIAAEKAGIMRAQKPVVCGEAFLPETFHQLSQQYQSLLFMRSEHFDVKIETMSGGLASCWSWLSYSYGHLECQIDHLHHPFIPLDNVATALQVLLVSGIKLNADKVNSWIVESKLSGRFECWQKPFQLVFDVAHNELSAKYLSENLKRHIKLESKRAKKIDRIYGVFSVLSDKPTDKILKPLIDIVDHWMFVDLGDNVPRRLPPNQIVDQFRQLKDEEEDNYSVYEAMQNTIEQLSKTVSEDDLIVVFGSFYTVAQAQEILSQ